MKDEEFHRDLKDVVKGTTLENAIGYAVGKALIDALEDIKVKENGGFFIYPKSEDLEKFFSNDWR